MPGKGRGGTGRPICFLHKQSRAAILGSMGFAQEVLERVAAPAGSALPLPRALLVFAHPDDEILAVGGRLERFVASRLLCVTDGAPRDGEDARMHGCATGAEYARARRGELEAALRVAGFPLERSEPLCIAGEPIADKQALNHLVPLVRALSGRMQADRPEAVLTHPYEGGHPDHDSCAFAVHAAVRLLGSAAPVVLEAPSYFAGDGGAFTTGRFLPGSSTLTISTPLAPEEQARKRERRACFRTQGELLERFPLAYELFRIAPAYDFAQPPHPGLLLYEGWGWNLDGAQWRAAAAQALRELGLA